MSIRKKSALIRIISLVLVVLALCPINANAVEPRASYYLDSYSANLYAAGNGVIQVWYDVTGVSYLDEIGALSIQIYESKDNSTWTWKKTFTHDSTSGMLAYNKFFYESHVDYQGVAGRYYKAYICIWGGKDGAGDTRYFWVSSKKAT